MHFLLESFRSFFSSQSLLLSITLIIIFSAVLAIFLRELKQQVIIAYLLAGVILGPLVLGLITDKNLITNLAQIGIAFLLFTAGLEMSIKKLREIIGTSVIAGIIQIVAVSIVSFLVLYAFSFGKVEALWTGIAIAFSSTVVVTKILIDTREISTLRGKIIVGIMLAQDIFAIIALSFLTKNLSLPYLLNSFLKVVLLTLIAFLLGYLSIPLMKKASFSAEILLISSLAFLFFFVIFSLFFNLSIAIGAFVAGVALANTPYRLEIKTRMKSLNDFFLVMFFVSIGLLLNNLSKEVLLLTLFLLGVLIFVETIVTACVLKFFGYSTKSSIKIGISFAQLSEFTLIILLQALSLGIISKKMFDAVVLTAIVSIALTPYLMNFTQPFIWSFGKILDLIGGYQKREKIILPKEKKTVFIFGCHRMGTIFLKGLEKYLHKILVIDFNPEIIEALENKGVSCVYGDASNKEFLSQLPTQDLKIIISTIPNKEENLLIINHFKKIRKTIFIAVTANRIDDALELYEAGADYVIMPMIISSEIAVKMILGMSKEKFKKYKQEHIEYLKKLHKYLY